MDCVLWTNSLLRNVKCYHVSNVIIYINILLHASKNDCLDNCIILFIYVYVCFFIFICVRTVRHHRISHHDLIIVKFIAY